MKIINFFNKPKYAQNALKHVKSKDINMLPTTYQDNDPTFSPFSEGAEKLFSQKLHGCLYIVILAISQSFEVGYWWCKIKADIWFSQFTKSNQLPSQPSASLTESPMLAKGCPNNCPIWKYTDSYQHMLLHVLQCVANLSINSLEGCIISFREIYIFLIQGHIVSFENVLTMR